MIVFGHDYETTGVNSKTCGVVQSALCFAQLFDNGSYEILSSDVMILHPGEPIPAGASNIHGIFDEHVIDSPPFEEYLTDALKVVNDTEIDGVFGYNNKSYDDVIARRCGLKEFPAIDLYVATRRFKSDGRIPGAKLSEAYYHLTGRVAENAHDAFADLVMTLDLIKPAMEMAERETLADFVAWLQIPTATKNMKMPFGKHKGVKLCNLPKSYVRWALAEMDGINGDLRAGLEMVR